MNKNYAVIIVFLLWLGQSVSTIALAASTQACGIVTIEKILTGSRHGAMMRISNRSCGSGGWVCLDPNAESMTEKESDRLFSFVLASKLAGQKVNVTVHSDIYPAACNGGYPAAEDVRTAN